MMQISTLLYKLEHIYTIHLELSGLHFVVENKRIQCPLKSTCIMISIVSQ